MEITTVLQALSDNQLIESISRLVVKEREVLYRVLVHLVEIEHRALHVKRGYSSLFDYCVRGLGYSGSAAQRRIKAARALKRFPQIASRIRDGRLSLNVLGAVADLLTDGNLEELLREAQGKSRDELAMIVARYKPVEVMMRRESVVPVVTRPRLKQALSSAPDLFERPKKTETHYRADVEAPAECAEVRMEAPPQDEFYRIAFAASPEFKEKLDRLRLLMSNSGSKSIEEVLLKTMDAYLEQHCPKKRLERREKRQARVAEKASVVESEVQENEPASRTTEPERSRHIPAAVRDEVLARDGYRCTYVSPEGIPCERTHGLELDHIVPFATGGNHTADNLQTVCRAHNQLYAKKFFGEEHIEAKIAKRRRSGASTWLCREPAMPYGDGRRTGFPGANATFSPRCRLS